MSKDYGKLKVSIQGLSETNRAFRQLGEQNVELLPIESTGS